MYLKTVVILALLIVISLIGSEMTHHKKSHNLSDTRFEELHKAICDICVESTKEAICNVCFHRKVDEKAAQQVLGDICSGKIKTTYKTYKTNSCTLQNDPDFISLMKLPPNTK